MNGPRIDKTCGEYRCRFAEDSVTIMQYIGPKPQAVQPIDAGRVVSVPAEIEGLPVTWIGVNAFRDSGVTDVTLPEGLEGIDARAFAFCRALRKISLPDSLKQVCEAAFRGCGQLEEICIPRNIREIPAQAFLGCRNLTSARVPADLEYIGKEAFRDCGRLENLIPWMLLKLREIGEGAFRGCGEMKGLMPGRSIERIGPRAFRECKSLTVTATEGTVAETYCRENMIRYVILTGKGKIIVPDPPAVEDEYHCNENEDGTLRIIRYDGKREKITVPEQIGGKTVTEIGDYAFCECDGLRKITLPDSVVRIGKQAFDNSVHLKEVTVGKNLREIGDEAFHRCFGLTRVEGIGPALRRIGKNAFRRCDWLEEFAFSAGPLEIGEHAFEHTRLTDVSIPEGTLSIGEYAFEDCYELKEVRLPEGLKKIGKCAFDDCTDLERIEIPSPDFELGETVFDGCVGLKEICLGEHERLGMAGRFLMDRKEKRLLAYCSGWKDQLCAVPAGTEIIGTCAFERAGMERAVLPEGVRSIEHAVFYGCKELKTVQLPGSLRVIGENAFADCCHLVWLSIPEGVEELGGWAFWNCFEMNRLRIPDSVKKIGSDLFGFGGHKPVCIVSKGSYAEKYCAESGFRMEVEG